MHAPGRERNRERREEKREKYISIAFAVVILLNQRVNIRRAKEKEN